MALRDYGAPRFPARVPTLRPMLRRRQPVAQRAWAAAAERLVPALAAVSGRFEGLASERSDPDPRNDWTGGEELAWYALAMAAGLEWPQHDGAAHAAALAKAQALGMPAEALLGLVERLAGEARAFARLVLDLRARAGGGGA